ncbi:hypothetical protein [Actinoplanes sp. NPDC020271]|uniref:hypothetical protein n=1 Tax=Actinoplanes sp. NPDC020271 TaxID=3363896 RepID=UPI00378F07BA
MMAIVILLWVAALAVGVWAVWPSTRTATPEPAGDPAVAGQTRPDSLEGVLVSQLIRAEITPQQYRRAVEGLAARDDQRHPMSVPRDEL